MYDEHYDRTRHPERYERIEQEPKESRGTPYVPMGTYVGCISLPMDTVKSHKHTFHVCESKAGKYVFAATCDRCIVTMKPPGITDKLIIDHFCQRQMLRKPQPCRIVVGVDWKSGTFDEITTDCAICALLGIK
ncbi:hypothetical protein F-S17_0193 [Faustovirus]|nr:hypothetical protein F-S17_0193 [Faustovirus]QJX72967.1 hypothetical protein F-VV57_0205 [Faustovirus]QJX73472.1 nudix hydrolase domain protein [Faustovirus]